MKLFMNQAISMMSCGWFMAFPFYFFKLLISSLSILVWSDHGLMLACVWSLFLWYLKWFIYLIFRWNKTLVLDWWCYSGLLVIGAGNGDKALIQRLYNRLVRYYLRIDVSQRNDIMYCCLERLSYVYGNQWEDLALYFSKIQILCLVSSYQTQKRNGATMHDRLVHGGVIWLYFKNLARGYMVLVSVLEMVLRRILSYQMRLGTGGYIGTQKLFIGLCYLFLVIYLNQTEDWGHSLISVLAKFNMAFITRYLCLVLNYDCYDDILVVTRAILGHFNLTLLLKWTIMSVWIGDWYIIDKWPYNYYPITDIDLVAVRIWWQWELDVKILSGIIKPVSSGSMEQYKYFYI